MAASSMKDIKNRIKSIESTMQITKAMELVASSKLKRAKENAEAVRPFLNTVYETLSSVASGMDEHDSVYAKRNADKDCFVIIAGDRGLAGGYNSNVFKLFESSVKSKDFCVLPIGKKSVEYCKKRGYEIVCEDFSEAASIGSKETARISELLTGKFVRGEIGSLSIVYTSFASMLSQTPFIAEVLPIKCQEDEKKDKKDMVLTMYEIGCEATFDAIIPQYAAALLYGMIKESVASELAARRTAMESASNNAEDIISDLSLKFNRARQAAITQELTEIVSGAEAL